MNIFIVKLRVLTHIQRQFEVGFAIINWLVHNPPPPLTFFLDCKLLIKIRQLRLDN